MAAKSIDDKSDRHGYVDTLVGAGWHWSGTVTYFFDNDASIGPPRKNRLSRGAGDLVRGRQHHLQEVFVEPGQLRRA